MRIAAMYSFNNGKSIIELSYPDEFSEVVDIITSVDASHCRNKVSREKTMPGRLLYSPSALNKAFVAEFEKRGWIKHRVQCHYSRDFYVSDFDSLNTARGAFREIDFVKNRVGVEVQFGKYAFMVYNVCAKMTIFHNLDVIDVGIEIVPVKAFADEMSTGVSFFEQFVWDLEHRGVSDIDIPVLIIGVTDELSSPLSSS
jgi:hypothetical protein